MKNKILLISPFFILVITLFFVLSGSPGCLPGFANSPCENVSRNSDNVPSDHTVVISDDGQMAAHKPGLFQPMDNCNSCHGLNLEGRNEFPSPTVPGAFDSPPCCYSCHDKKW